MGRGQLSDKAASARKLLYGPRKQGSGPKTPRPDPLSYDDFINLLFAKRLPPDLARAFPEISFSGEPYAFQPAGSDGETLHVIYLDGVADSSIALSFIRDSGRPTIAFDYAAHNGEAPRPGSKQEKQFLAYLADRLSGEEVHIQLNIYQRQDIQSLVDAYGPDFRFASDSYGDDVSEEEIIDRLAERNISGGYLDAGELRRFKSFAEICSRDRGREALNELLRYDDIYLRRPLADFRSED